MSDEGNGFFDQIPEEQKVRFVWREHVQLRDDLRGHKARVNTRVDDVHTALREMQMWRAKLMGGAAVISVVAGIVGGLVTMLMGRLIP